jgi:hypothetical protein
MEFFLVKNEFEEVCAALKISLLRFCCWDLMFFDFGLLMIMDFYFLGAGESGKSTVVKQMK